MLCELSAIQCDLLLMYYYSKQSRIKSFPWSTLPINPKVIVWTVQESPKVFVMTISISNIIGQQYDLLTLRVSDNVQKQYRKQLLNGLKEQLLLHKTKSEKPLSTVL